MADADGRLDVSQLHRIADVGQYGPVDDFSRNDEVRFLFQCLDDLDRILAPAAVFSRVIVREEVADQSDP